MRIQAKWAKWGWTAGACVVASAAFGVAQAQTAPSRPLAPAASTPETSVGMQRQVQLTPREQLSQAEGIVARVSTTGSNVRRRLEQARSQRDVVKTLCLNDKLNQIDVAARSAVERRTALEGAVTRNDVDLSNHEFTILTVLRQRVEQLSTEANMCFGGEELPMGSGVTQVTTTINPNIATTDPVPPQPPSPPPPPPPPPASQTN